MGSLFSKRKHETNAPEKTKARKRFWKKTPGNDGSTQSLNGESDLVYTTPLPNVDNQHERAMSLPSLQCPEVSPPVPLRQQEKITKAQSHSNICAGVSTPLRRESSSGPNKETTNQRLTAPAGKLYSRGHYSSPKPNLVQVKRTSGPQTQIEMSVRTGDQIHIGDRKDDGRYIAINLRTGKEGLVSANCETMVTNNDVESQNCFFKHMDRASAETKLEAPDIELGTYLLRPSDDYDDYALSLRCESELYELDVRHYKVRVTDKGFCYIDVESIPKPFSNIVELIKYYTENAELQCELKKPFSKNDPLNDITVKCEDLELGEKLGSGNFATVYAGTLNGSKPVAVKSLREASSMTVEEFRMEATTMLKLRHPNLVSLLAISETNGKIHIITERMSKGALLDLLRKDEDHVITFKDLMDMAIQVVEGMCFLESKSFVHRDLRAANVLVGDGNLTKIADFGLARILNQYYEHEEFYQDIKVSALLPYKWTAPEAINQLKFTVKSDVWSFGILLYEMVTHGNEPYAAMSNHESLAWVLKGNRLERPDDHHCPFTLYNIMKQCWLTIPSERPNFKYLKNNLIEIKPNV